MTARHFNLADLFELVAEQIPDRPAVVGGDTRLTYDELDRRTNQLARHLRAQGLQPGAKVGIYSWNRTEWVELFLGAFKARLVPININYRYVAHELRYVLDNADIELLAHERAFAPTVAEILPDLPQVRSLLVLEDGTDHDAGDAVSYEDALAAQSDEPLGEERSPDDLYMLYTGGTTGMPKGVMWRGEDIYHAALSGFDGVLHERPEDVTGRITAEESRMSAMLIAPLMHGAAQWGLMNMLYGGGTAVLYTGHGFDAHEICRTIEREKVMSLLVVGDAMARPIADAIADPSTSYDLSSVVAISSGGAIFSPAVKDQLRALLPSVFVVDSFGASETGANGQNVGAEARRFTMSPETTVLGDDLRPVEPGSGVIGRLARRGHIPLGYYKDEAKTAATFVTDADGDRWVVPGDFAVVEEDKTITVLGRGSQCINTGGEKVYPEEVEEALKSHPDVFDALVVGLPDERFGERVAAVISAREGKAPTLEELSDHCHQTIAGYKTPRQLVVVDAIQRTPAGKANYRWAKEAATAGQT